jgi:hypothetical protein
VTSPQHSGDPQHPNHEEWLLELGRASYAAARVAGICFDLARVFGSVDSADMYNDPLGTLINRLNPLEKKGAVPGLGAFIKQLDSARGDRNDLLHALPVAHGLHRRSSKDSGYVRNFFDVGDLEPVTRSLSEAARRGNELLYQDGGAAVSSWYRAQRGG